MTAAEVLAAWQNTADAATDGPWTSGDNEPDEDFAVFAAGAGADIILAERLEDAEFIALSRDALPRAVAALQAVLSLCDDYERAGHRRTNGTVFEVIAVRRDLLIDAIDAALGVEP